MILLHNAILNDKAVDITIVGGLIDSISNSSLTHSSVSKASVDSTRSSTFGSPNLGEQPEIQPASDRGSSSSPKLGEVPEGRRSVLSSKSHSSQFIDCSGLAVFPGLCNMHSHAPMTLLRGLGDDQPLNVWLNKYIWPAEQKLTDELIYQGTLKACHEMLASGTTFFNDMYFRLPSMAQAVRDSGIKARLGFNVFGEGEELEEWLSNPDNSQFSILNSQFSIAPHSIYTVSKRGLQRSAKVCKELGVPMHIHMSETQKEVDDCLREHSCRPWEWLDKLGILDTLGENIIAAHCLHLSENEIRLIGDHGITCVHCPNSNLKLGSGYRFPMLELLEAGAKVALGTDGSASSNNLDIIEVMKTAALLQKGWRGDPTVVPAAQILSLATLGHTIAPGQPADLFLVRLNTRPRQPQAAATPSNLEGKPDSTRVSPSSSISDLVYATHGDSVVLTLVDGKVVYRKEIRN